jgi:hypothetical protein
MKTRLIVMLATMFVAALGVVAPASAHTAPRVLIIGDSTTVDMRDTLDRDLRGYGLDPTIDARNGRTLKQGRTVLASYDLSKYDYVVVLLGTNGKRSSSERNMRALKAMGVDTVATVQTPKKRKVNRAAKTVFGTERIPWAGYAKAHGIHTKDGKHYTRAGYRKRAAYISKQIASRVDYPIWAF